MRRSQMLTLAALLLSPAVAHGQSGCGRSAAQLVGPVVAVCVNHSELYTFQMRQEGDLSVLALGTQSVGNGASFTVSAQLDRDPYAHFLFTSVLPSGHGPIVYDAWFTTDIAPVAYGAATSFGLANVAASGIIAGGMSAGGKASQGTYPVYIAGSTNLGSLGVDLGTGLCEVAASPSPTPQQCNYGTAQSVFGAIIPNTLTARLSYTHVTEGDGVSTVSWSGGVDLHSTTVPEPGTLWMALAGAMIAFVAGNKRRS